MNSTLFQYRSIKNVELILIERPISLYILPFVTFILTKVYNKTLLVIENVPVESIINNPFILSGYVRTNKKNHGYIKINTE